MISRLKYIFLSFSLMACCCASTYAQQDSFTGEWQYNLFSNTDSAFQFTLRIATPERNVLYPAEAIVKVGDQQWAYSLLFARKDIRTIGIGNHSYPQNKASANGLLVNFAGYLDLHRDLKGMNKATLQRINTAIVSPGIEISSNKYLSLIFRELSKPTFSFVKTSDSAWRSYLTEQILTSNNDSLYYGIHDSVFINNRSMTVHYRYGRKSGNGILSFYANGNMVADKISQPSKKRPDEISLDTGVNVLVMFTDQFGKSMQSTGKMGVKTQKNEYLLSHADERDANAAFIVLRAFYSNEELSYEESMILREYYDRLNSPDNLTVNPEGLIRDSTGKLLAPARSKFTDQERILRKSVDVGSVNVKIKKITLAIWDDAVEDGDTISLRINDRWIVQNMAVKKKPQFLTVQVEPGPNKITFIAENLGAIIPNTSVLEINDGRQRKAFFIDTDLDQNNGIQIIYDPRY